MDSQKHEENSLISKSTHGLASAEQTTNAFLAKLIPKAEELSTKQVCCSAKLLII